MATNNATCKCGKTVSVIMGPPIPAQHDTLRLRKHACSKLGPATWDGLCPAGKHGLDYKGQPCDLCPEEG